MELFQSWENCSVDGVATLRCIPIVFHNIVTAALIFSGITAVVFIIIAGYKFMTSGGDPKQVEGARKTMIYSVLGLVLILLSFAIVSFISITTGVTCINAFTFNNCDTAPRTGGAAAAPQAPPSQGNPSNQNDQNNDRNDNKDNDKSKKKKKKKKKEKKKRRR